MTLAEFLAIYDQYEAASKKPKAAGQANSPGTSDPVSRGTRMGDWTAERAAEKASAVENIEIALRAVESSGCEPDWWEREQLVEAIGALFRGAYRLALCEAELALAPRNERSPDTTAKCGDLARFSLSDLRRAFVVAKDEPLRRFPHSGPIVFTGDGGQ